MSNKTKRVLTASAISLIAFTVLLAVAWRSGYSLNANTVIEVTNSKAFPEYATHTFQVKNAGSYVLSADWSKNEQPGFITGLTFTDEDGNTLYSISGGQLFFDTAPMKLKAGKYICRLEYLCDEASYNAFQRANSLPEGLPDTEWFKDGTFNFGFTVKVNESDKVKDAAMICCAVIIAIMLVFTIITLIKDDKSVPEKYDERQIAVQGKAYKLGFFTVIAVNLVFMVFSGFLGTFAQTGVYLCLGIVIGACVTVTSLIMNDAYFRLDQNKTAFFVIVAAFAVINLVLGIRNIVKGNAMVDGTVSFIGTANLILGIMVVYVFIVLLIKKIRDGKEAADEES